MNDINEILFNKKIILKEIKNITPKTRKKIEIFLGVDMKNIYYLLVKIETKSRFLLKNSKDLVSMTINLTDINFKKKKKILFIKSPICSKAKEFLENNGWRIL